MQHLRQNSVFHLFVLLVLTGIGSTTLHGLTHFHELIETSGERHGHDHDHGHDHVHTSHSDLPAHADPNVGAERDCPECEVIGTLVAITINAQHGAGNFYPTGNSVPRFDRGPASEILSVGARAPPVPVV